MTTGGDGMVFIRGTFDSEGGATIRTAVEALAIKSGQDDTRLKTRRLADALVELSGQCMDAGLLPTRATERPHLQVTTSLETFIGLSGSDAAELEFSLPISSTAVQRLTCDCSVTSLLFGDIAHRRGPLPHRGAGETRDAAVGARARYTTVEIARPTWPFIRGVPLGHSSRNDSWRPGLQCASFHHVLQGVKVFPKLPRK